MEKDTKRVWHLPYCFLEPGELERKFARLAAQGWLLEKCTYGDLHLSPRRAERV